MPRKIISVKSGGRLTMIHDDRLIGLSRQGHAMIRRASHVEPGDPKLGQDPLRWYADMAPSGGSVLGPFGTRREALEAEVAWLNECGLSGIMRHRSTIPCCHLPTRTTPPPG